MKSPLQEYERLDLSDLVLPPQPKPVHYTLRAAIMYSKRHHWAYLHDQPPIFVSDATSRVATPGDVGLVARCARTLVYERTVPAEAAVIRMAMEQQTLRNQQTADAQPPAAGAEVQTTTAQQAAEMATTWALAADQEQAAVALALAAAAKELQRKELTAVTRLSVSRPASTKETKGHAATRRAGGDRSKDPPTALKARAVCPLLPLEVRGGERQRPQSSQWEGLARNNAY